MTYNVRTVYNVNIGYFIKIKKSQIIFLFQIFLLNLIYNQNNNKMAHELIFTGSIEEPNEVNVSFYVGPDGYVYVKQPNEDYELAPSRLETEDIRTLINFLQSQLPQPKN